MFATGPRRRKSLKFVCVFGHDDMTALMKVLHDMLLPVWSINSNALP